MRPSTVNFTPFMDDTTGQSVSFVNLPIDAGVHRDLVTASAIPPQAAGPHAALIGSNPDGSQTPVGITPTTSMDGNSCQIWYPQSNPAWFACNNNLVGSMTHAVYLNGDGSTVHPTEIHYVPTGLGVPC